MKLMLGAVELADIPNDVAEDLIRLFCEPGALASAPQITPLSPQAPYHSHLEGSTLAVLAQKSGARVSLELMTTTTRKGPLVRTPGTNRFETDAA